MTTSLLARYRVRDIDAFRAVFRDFEPERRTHGSTGHSLYVAGPREVMAVIDFPDAATARAFAASADRAEALERAGVEERLDTIADLVEWVVPAGAGRGAGIR
jgi:hypothetical protein